MLQAAHWSAADLRNRVLSPASIDTVELSLTTTAADLLLTHQKRRRVTPRSRVSSSAYSSTSIHGDHTNGTQEMYHLLPTDDTHRIGAGGLLFLNTTDTALPVASIPGLPDLGPEVDQSYSVEGARPAKFRPPPQGEKTAFGLLRESLTKSQLIEQYSNPMKVLDLGSEERDVPKKWTKLDPYRFSVEFWGVDKLVEKERAYSSTHFYAGSWFNVYVQTIRKKDKGTQLGIYLHRQNPNEVFPKPSAPRQHKDHVEESSRPRSLSTPQVSSTPLTTLVPGLTSPGFEMEDANQARTSDRKDENDGYYTDPRKVTRVSWTAIQIRTQSDLSSAGLFLDLLCFSTWYRIDQIFFGSR